MDEMIERVARAMLRKNAYFAGRHSNDEVRELARAAILAMREPTEAMMRAGEDAISREIYANESDEAELSFNGEVTAWQAMIDAALAP